ncbi:Flp family type IVb pilin [Jiella mangrovi]|uniref:Flp family type IVb pilin n=1 Tax=Jiella mangrovi TaxID=2821407 RepID=A0ABS4BKA2_9HYPH|nr:Flp family type IVb pilin [Jiella mangrovi]MBP0617174.1 Flp family type IVb pilin [Jiella mangrovi]
MEPLIMQVGTAAAPRFRRFCRCETGSTAIEYALIGVVMAVAILGAYTVLKEPLETLFTHIGNSMGV